MVQILDNSGSPIPDPNGKRDFLSYHIDKKAIGHLEKIKKRINKRDKDYVMIIDGYEGSGKSTLAQQFGKYVDPTLELDRVCMTADEFKNAIIKASKGQCIIYDEAVTGLAASESITRIGRLLKSMMMQMRQKNLFVIVIIPTIFELGRYAVLSRARCLFHVYERGENDHRWVGYNQRDLKSLYLKGKKTYSYRVKSFFIGRFFGIWAVNEEKYIKKKADVLFMMDEVGERGGFLFKRAQRNEKIGVYLLIKEGWTQQKIVEEFKKLGGAMSKGSVGNIKREMSENKEKMPMPITHKYYNNR
ncbi:MAG: hypothetical protein JSW08_00005 [archaeon]|nr:MAG: hypothetical protein JSW08_00005 [archaeon]